MTPVAKFRPLLIGITISSNFIIAPSKRSILAGFRRPRHYAIRVVASTQELHISSGYRLIFNARPCGDESRQTDELSGKARPPLVLPRCFPTAPAAR